MRRFLVPGLLAGYSLVLLGILAVTCQQGAALNKRASAAAVVGIQTVSGAEEAEAPPDNPAPYDGADPSYNPNDPPLKRLVHCSSRYDRNHTTRFFNALSALFQKNNLPLTDYEPGWFIDEGYAVPIREANTSYVVAILRGWGHILPGDDSQYLFLLDADGKILDRVVCAVDARRTRESVEHPGTLHTELPRKPASDGARLILRFLPSAGEALSGSWTHQIVACGQAREVHWDIGKPGDVSFATFKEKGICRVAIHDGKLVVIYPDYNKD